MVSYLSLVVYVALSFATGFFSLRLSSWLLQGLHSYHYPENSLGKEQDAQIGTGPRSMKEKEAENSVNRLNESEGPSVERERNSKVGKEDMLHDETEGLFVERGRNMKADKEDRQVGMAVDETVKDGGHLQGDGDQDEVKNPEIEACKNLDEQQALSNTVLHSTKSSTKELSRPIAKNIRKRKEKVKDRFNWEEGKSQILRLSLGRSHLQGRQYFQEYEEAVIYSVLGVTNLLARELLCYVSASEAVHVSLKTGFLRSDDLIPFCMGLFAVYKVARLLARVGWERSTSRISELTLSCLVGCIGFLLAVYVLNFARTTMFDFGFEKVFLDVGRVSTSRLEMESKQQIGSNGNFAPILVNILSAALAGWLSGVLMSPAHRSIRSFWLGTDQLQWNIPVINSGPLIHLLLYLNVIFPILASVLWIKPMGELFIASDQCPATRRPELSVYRGTMQDQWHKKKWTGQGEDDLENVMIRELRQREEDYLVQDSISRSRANTEESVLHEFSNRNEGKEKGIYYWIQLLFPAPSANWAQDFGMSEKSFEEVRLWSLLVAGLLQLCLFRVNIQTYLNEAVLIWYESLHRSKVMNLELTRAKLVLNSYFLCRAAIQCLVPGLLVILFLGMSRVLGKPSSLNIAETFSSVSLYIRALALFMAWWVTFTWAALTCTILALYRIGFLLAS